MKITKSLIKIRNGFSEWKIYVSRVSSYINIVNMGGILFLMLQNNNVNLRKWGILIFIGALIIVTILGWLDSYLGLFNQEIKRASDRNAYLVEIRDGIRELRNK